MDIRTFHASHWNNQKEVGPISPSPWRFFEKEVGPISPSPWRFFESDFHLLTLNHKTTRKSHQCHMACFVKKVSFSIKYMSLLIL